MLVNVLRLRSSLLSWLPVLALCAAPALAQDGGVVDGGGATDGGGGGDAGAPAGWTCTASFYGSDDGCDCGCGEADPDCGGDASAAVCFTANGGYNHCDDDGAESVPVDGQNHTCQANACGDGFVVGMVEECDDLNATGGDGCSADCSTVEEGYRCPTSGGACTQIPAGWTCNASYYGADDGCDCGCGVMDADCPAGATIAECEFDYCDDAVDPNDITQCITTGGGDAGTGGGDDAGTGGGDDAGTGGGDDAGTGGGGGGNDAGPGGDDEPADSCSSTAVTASSAPLSLALLALFGAALLRRRRD